MMNSWFCLPLGDGLMASAPSDQIVDAFNQAFTAAGRPADMAVFTRYDTEGHLQCEVTAYFSPAAAEIARTFEAHACSRPVREGLGLLAGEERAWSILFSEPRPD